MSNLLCMRRRGQDGRSPAGADAVRLWYVEGFSVTLDGRELGRVELVLPTLDGTAPASLLVRRSGGDTALVEVAAVAEVLFAERRLAVTVEPASFDAIGLDGPDRSGGDSWPASA